MSKIQIGSGFWTEIVGVRRLPQIVRTEWSTSPHEAARRFVASKGLRATLVSPTIFTRFGEGADAFTILNALRVTAA